MMRNHGTLIMGLVGWVACHSHGDELRTTLSPPIRLTHQVVVESADGSMQRTLRPQGDRISNGDRVYANVTPEEGVFLYLGYCDGRTFKLYPELDSDALVRAAPGGVTRIPEKVGLGIDGNTEFEVIYLIASRSSLRYARAELQVKLAESRGTPDGDCSGPTRDRSGSAVPPQKAVDVRSPDGIKVERYQLKRQPPG